MCALQAGDPRLDGLAYGWIGDELCQHGRGLDKLAVVGWGFEPSGVDEGVQAVGDGC